MASKPVREYPPTQWRAVVDDVLRFLLTDDLPSQLERDLARGFAEITFAGRTVVVPEGSIEATVAQLRLVVAADGVAPIGEPVIRRRRLDLKHLGLATVNVDAGLRSALSDYHDLLLASSDAGRGNQRFDRCVDALSGLCAAPLTDDAVSAARAALRRALGRKAGRESDLSRNDRIMRACDLVIREPNLSTKVVAARVGVDRTTLGRSEKFVRARKAGVARLRPVVGGGRTGVPVDREMPHGRRNARMPKSGSD